MKRFLTCFILFILFILLLIPYIKVLAVEMDLESEQNSEQYLSATSDSNIDNSPTTNTDASTSNSYSNPRVTTTSSNNGEFLTIENILSIIIIVIGIILIFLGIAILVRCK